MLEEKLNDPSFYQKSIDEFNKTAQDLSLLKAKIEEKETLWLELEILANES